MNILFVIGIYPNIGGTEKMTTILSNSFVASGHNVSIASFEQKCPELIDNLHGVNLIPLSKPVNSKKNTAILREFIEKHNIDVIINQWCLPFYVTRLLNRARRGTKARIISVLHGVPDRSKIIIRAEDRVKSSRGIKKIISLIKLKLVETAIRYSLRYVYRHTDRYVVLSDGFKKSFQDYAGISDTPKLIAIGNPITIETDYSTDFQAIKAPMLLYVGRMDMENKRVNRIIEVWQAIYKEYPDWQLTLVGDGPHKKALEKYVEDNNIERVIFTGFLKEDPIEYYKKASILMLTSDLEGFGLVIVEGMSYGVVPVVYGSYVSVFDIIENGKSGIITSMPYSKDETINAVAKLMTSQVLRNKMSHNAINASKKFRINEIHSKWNALLDDIKVVK